MRSDWALRTEIRRWVDATAPPAPWLEDRVISAVRVNADAEARTAARSRRDFGVLGGFGSGLRLAAGLVAVLITVAAVAALLVSTRLLHNPTVPGGRSAPVHASSPSPPPGGPVPNQLLGVWYLPPSAVEAATGNPCPSPPTSTNCYVKLTLTATTYTLGFKAAIQGSNQSQGGVVVNNNEIDFFNGVNCGLQLPDGVGRYTWTLNGGLLYFTLISDACPRSGSLAQQGWSRTT